MMKKIISFLIAMVPCLSVTACGGSSDRADDALAGKYLTVKGTTMGCPFPVMIRQALRLN